MPACHFNLLRSVDIRQEPQTEPLRVGGVREAVHSQGGLLGMEGLPYARVQLIVGDTAPMHWLCICHRLGICLKKQRWLFLK